MKKRKKSLVGYIPKEHNNFKWQEEFRHQPILNQIEQSRKIIRIPLILTKPYFKVRQKVRITIEEL